MRGRVAPTEYVRNAWPWNSFMEADKFESGRMHRG